MIDSDGPCAYTEPNGIEESVAYPLAALGFFLISISLIFPLLALSTGGDVRNQVS